MYKTGEQIMVSLCPISVAADCATVYKSRTAGVGADKTAESELLTVSLQFFTSYKS